MDKMDKVNKRERARQMVQNDGMSYAAVARELGVSVNTVWRWLHQTTQSPEGRSALELSHFDHTEHEIVLVDADGVPIEGQVALFVDVDPTSRVVTDFSIEKLDA